MKNPAEIIIEILENSDISDAAYDDIVEQLDELEQGWLRCQTLEQLELDSLGFIDDVDEKICDLKRDIADFIRSH